MGDGRPRFPPTTLQQRHFVRADLWRAQLRAQAGRGQVGPRFRVRRVRRGPRGGRLRRLGGGRICDKRVGVALARLRGLGGLVAEPGSLVREAEQTRRTAEAGEELQKKRCAKQRTAVPRAVCSLQGTPGECTHRETARARRPIASSPSISAGSGPRVWALYQGVSNLRAPLDARPREPSKKKKSKTPRKHTSHSPQHNRAPCKSNKSVAHTTTLKL